MRGIIVAFISYGTAVNDFLFGLWLATKWSAPGWKHFAAAGSVFMAMNVVMQVLVG
ncbi:hypothetical protein GCM10012320_12030 [Sinomonas cellulolyticus]|uniref:Uncharacterized protein n=1 Tax=Sinomonas cellulolyticus TaxID=2801916 RepID=A0ABS1JZ33_9MICC|nr:MULTISPECIES: hypothetical protein [Sinomonas]MBL0704644.1 hypothetical protein [Sinomonas cellulolyticus]GHG46145.1 hypothetical protein GCM10012320_12030 [Sinomonas sp. KCTC 49339]